VGHADGTPHQHHGGDPVLWSDTSAERGGEGLEDDEGHAEEGDGVADVVWFQVGILDEGGGGYVADVCLDRG
jgi:hypothetical protein